MELLPRFAFQVINEKIASLTVTRADHPSGRLVLPPILLPDDHWGFGMIDCPLFSFTNWAQIDDELVIEPIAGGAFVGKEATCEAPFLAAYRKWADVSRAVRGEHVLNLLPAGDYILVRSPLAPRPTIYTVMGNSIQFAPSHLQRIFCAANSPSEQYFPDARIFPCLPCSAIFASVFGAKNAEAPSVDQPLVGIPFLSSGGSHHVYFLPFSMPGNEDPGEGLDLVLVIPLAGELILRADGRAEDYQRVAGRRWKEELLDPCICFCLGEKPNCYWGSL